MTLAVQITLVLALVLSVFIPFGYFFLGARTKARYKKSIGANVFFFFGTMVVATVIMLAGGNSAAAAEATATAAATGLSTGSGLGFIAAALATGLSCVGGGIAVGSAASAALGAVSEDSGMLGKSMIYVGLAEGVCLYGLIISFMILGRL